MESQKKDGRMILTKEIYARMRSFDPHDSLTAKELDHHYYDGKSCLYIRLLPLSTPIFAYKLDLEEHFHDCLTGDVNSMDIRSARIAARIWFSERIMNEDTFNGKYIRTYIKAVKWFISKMESIHDEELPSGIDIKD